MTDPNPAKFNKLVTLLRELFQLDQPDLDFGIYRIMHAKADEVTKFLDRELLPQVKDAFASYQSADSAELKKTLAEREAQYQADGVDPSTVPGIQKLREQLNGAVDIGALENETYDHLHSFFRRYYSEGDFLAKRVYKPGVYAIPYEGEEVTLHWANKDQYYIKTSEYLRDYAFRLKPEAGEGADAMRVHFKLVDAAEGEHGNVKAAEDNKRVFVLAAEDFIALRDGELELRFEYRPATLDDWPADQRDGKKKPPAQKELLEQAEARIKAADGAFADWLAELAKPHIKADGEAAGYSRLAAHLRRYAARNTFDYFIHKDLGGFLRRELDFYIKNEVMHLDDVESDTVPKVEQYLSKIKVIRRIAGKIIDFLAQLENFQKRLWLKKKFVVGSDWLVAVSQVPDELLPEVCANAAQLEEWKELHSLHELPADVTLPAYSEPLTPAYLRAYPALMCDTRHFSRGFIDDVLATEDALDEAISGLLINSENSQALNFLVGRFAGRIPVVYIDPPYNTPYSKILYKNNYEHSSWLSLMSNTLPMVEKLWAPSFSFGLAIDDYEMVKLSMLLDSTFPALSRSTVVVNHHPQGSGGRLSRTHEYLLLVSPNDAPIYSGASLGDEDEDRNFMRSGTAENNYRHGRWRSFYALLQDPETKRIVDTEEPVPLGQPYPMDSTRDGLIRIYPVNSRREERVWRSSFETGKDRARNGELWVSDRGAVYQSIEHENRRQTIFSNWIGPEFNAGTNGTQVLADMGLAGEFDYPKSLGTMQAALWAQSYGSRDFAVLDYFGGSGTTAHAVISMNQKDGGARKFLMVEVGTHFDRVLVKRVKKAAFATEWANGTPSLVVSTQEAERSPRLVKVLRLESYEDTLNNLALQRSVQQQGVLELGSAQGADGLREQYLLRYQLDVESKGSQSLLNVGAFADPTAYKLLVKTPGSDESREVNVDLLETFNWLLGLTVQHITAPRSFNAAFQRDRQGRLQLDGRLRQDAEGPWWFRTVTGTTPEGRKTLVVWRKLTGNAEQDNLVLDTWFRDKQAYSVRGSEFDLIYVNGDNTLENLRVDPETWKVRLIEEDFQRLMFDGTDA
ncbi:site-specific DNA-methyltransferase [Thermomonas sp. RSS23]|uniref:site-specific DNA-methyltransferase (adenine-specific) n=1 Tax=Thermomonas beijingensis TaxID=2872701 RepID=A0ABS7TA93_9GAMM|nr:DNA methyltransferase [Thermomonas beijingensis]MBZ4184781.1 site-specific DNA-methyltransferase [Thermomonas beijingensis]